MKKLLFLAALLLFVTNTFAQLVVDSTGYVGIGTEYTPFSTFAVGSRGWSNTGSSFESNKKYGVRIYNHPTSASDTIRALDVLCKPTNGTAIGTRSIANGSPYGISVGVQGFGGNSEYSCGVHAAMSSASNVTNFVGIYSSAGYSNFPYAPSGFLAGYFQGDIRVTGRVNGTVLSTAASSTSGNVATMPLDDEERMIDRLQGVNTIKFSREECNTEDIPENNDEIVQTKISDTAYSLDAEQLKAVCPELVYQDEDGTYSINYAEMVPILVKSLRELSTELTELKKELGVERKKINATGLNETSGDTDIIRMSQNNPNPFSESSVIALNIPQSAKSAAIYVYDLSGKQVSNVPVQERGETNVTMYASQLSAGMFIYSLVVDGKVCVTRRMIVEE